MRTILLLLIGIILLPYTIIQSIMVNVFGKVGEGLDLTSREMISILKRFREEAGTEKSLLKYLQDKNILYRIIDDKIVWNMPQRGRGNDYLLEYDKESKLLNMYYILITNQPSQVHIISLNNKDRTVIISECDKKDLMDFEKELYMGLRQNGAQRLRELIS
ncbi:MAG: hypothetical protein QG641_1983 [Candidatus Poribacteria bacterium]|nr:hypothetical protein [Candidatus Poribacteria bacterium]